MRNCQADGAQADGAIVSNTVGNLRVLNQGQQFSDVAQGRKNPLWMGLPSRLRRVRLSAELSARQVANKATCAKNLPNGVEAGKHVPSIGTVEKLASALGISPIYLAFGNEGFEPFRLKTPSFLKSTEEPPARPGEGNYAERYRGCGERVKSSRERLGLSLRALAEAADVSYQAVLYTESGQTVPRVDTIEAIAVALDVAPGWLAYGEDE